MSNPRLLQETTLIDVLVGIPRIIDKIYISCGA